MTAEKRKDLYWVAAKIAIAVGLCFFLIHQIHFQELQILVARISIPWVVGFLVCFLGSLLLSSFRYWVMTGKPITFMQYLRVVILQNSLSIFVATGAGMISYVSVLRAQHQLTISKGIGSLLFAKIGDFIYYLVFLILTALIVSDKVSPIETFLFAAIGAGLLIFLLLMFIYLGRKWMLLRLERFLQNREMYFQGIHSLNSAISNLRSFSISRKEFVSFFINTLLLNTVTISSFYCTLRMFSVVVSVPCVFFVNSIIQFISMIPIQVFGGLGVCDVPSMYLYSLFGVNRSEIASVLVLSRVVMYSLYALLLLLMISKHGNRGAAKETETIRLRR
jgi:uncharacterized protein (TIRG00374 family)